MEKISKLIFLYYFFKKFNFLHVIKQFFTLFKKIHLEIFFKKNLIFYKELLPM